MKKFLFLAALPLMLAACGDDNDEPKSVTLEYPEISVDYKATVKNKASEKNCTWTSANDFIATVDGDGNISGEHVGTTVITVTSKDGAVAKCTVTVKPTNTNFTLPYLSWGATRQQVKDEMATWTGFREEYDDEDGLGFVSTANSGLPGYSYGFNSNERLNAAGMTVSEEQDDEDNWDFYGFLLQYYKKGGEQGNDFVLYNSANPADATMTVVYGPQVTGNTIYYRAIWGESTGTRGVDEASVAKVEAGLARLVNASK
ncbi:MAG: hypothetical protein HDR80_09770 [Bacteroides sp.]|nr:hypothetical protein [Bacteroides sp.]MBD5371409.1 hypothetical protein [Bacteroides sp.]